MGKHMIRLTTKPQDGARAQYVAQSNISLVIEAGWRSQLCGVRSIVRTFDGEVLECVETADDVAAAIAKAEGEKG